LEALARAEEGVSAGRLFELAGIGEEDGRAALGVLQQHDVVMVEEEGVGFMVPLMGRWIREVKK
jgi:hypothetical protein